MNSHRHLLYVSDLVPGPGQGGQVILDRHLRRLAAEGWEITIVSSQPARLPGPWQHRTLPARRWWWPPFRPRHALLAALRARAWELELRAVPRADAIVTVVGGKLGWLAAHLATVQRAPLVAFVHDHWRECGASDDARVAERVCRSARHLLAVSEEMRASLAAEFPRTPCSVLPPIPAERAGAFATWREIHASRPVIAHVGALHAYHAPFLERVARTWAERGGTLLLLCPADNPVLTELRRHIPNLRHQSFFPENRDALAFIAEHASALAVMYPFGREEHGAPPTGFPSRFVEFVQLGLPILIAAPLRNPIRSWAQRHAWPAQIDPADEAALQQTAEQFTTRAGWETCARAAQHVAEGEFDANAIHRRFSELLDQLPARSRAA